MRVRRRGGRGARCSCQGVLLAAVMRSKGRPKVKFDQAVHSACAPLVASSMAGPSTFVMKRRRSCSCSASAAPVVALYPASGRPSGTYVGKQGPFGRGHLCSSSRLIGRGGPKPGAAWGLNLPPRVLRELPGGGSGRRERRPAFQHGRGTVVRSADERTKLRALPKNPASALLSCVPAMCLHGRTRQNRCLAASGWLATASRCDQSRGARPLLTGVESSLEPSDAGRCGQLRPSTTGQFAKMRPV